MMVLILESRIVKYSTTFSLLYFIIFIGVEFSCGTRIFTSQNTGLLGNTPTGKRQVKTQAAKRIARVSPQPLVRMLSIPTAMIRGSFHLPSQLWQGRTNDISSWCNLQRIIHSSTTLPLQITQNWTFLKSMEHSYWFYLKVKGTNPHKLTFSVLDEFTPRLATGNRH
jgi:hypothetical protein